MSIIEDSKELIHRLRDERALLGDTTRVKPAIKRVRYAKRYKRDLALICYTFFAGLIFAYALSNIIAAVIFGLFIIGAVYHLKE